MRPAELLATAALMRVTAQSLRELADGPFQATVLAYLHRGELRAEQALPSDWCRETAALLDDFAETLEALARR